MFKLCFYVPPSHLEVVKQALFAAGAGQIGNYAQCCWQTLGQGQFRPLPGSQAFIGEQGQLEQLAEWKVEMVLEDARVQAVVQALKQAHPYETPAFDLWRLAVSRRWQYSGASDGVV
ncbi:YqfO family protein [Pseudomonas sp. 5P_3.1_Bac2]|uniref:Nif3-like dinuclear metal center hexameric protein n=1 Tax=Pseudomonas sp. 5P_3.1_Bac2 TaxID=2971617 RepID=UPI0021C61879|nr:YqfO family protein [Pseudomonas sp. 5P_3.1_Bac2]MCU1719591.1 YqfO family protein [Pseudomonas sp. 5P_3.1_Bac2]